MILAGDVGGTKTNIAIFDHCSGRAIPRRVRATTYQSKRYGGLDAIISEFLRRDERPVAACFGVAGPVLEDRSETSNLPWVIDAGRIASQFGIPRVVLVNDLVATAIGAASLGPDDLTSLNGRMDPSSKGAKLVLAPGTGFGMAALVRSGSEWIPVPSEGGHADLPGRYPEHAALVAYLTDRYGHVSIERAVSGPGLTAIFGFVVDTGRGAANAEVLRSVVVNPHEAPRTITQHALARTCPASVEALRLFIELFGTVAGNLALTLMATGGVLLGGGIAPKIVPALTDRLFMHAFTDKGRFRELLERIPVAVIPDPEAALYGAAMRAAREVEPAKA